MPVTSVKGLKRMAEIACAHIPAPIAKVFEGLDADPDTRSLVAATVASDMCQELGRPGLLGAALLHPEPGRSWFTAVCRMLGVTPAAAEAA